MVRDGIYYALGFTAAGVLISWLLGPAAAVPLFLLAAFCAWFFRDPERPIPVGSVAVSPADGKVVAVVREDGRTRISIFLNIFDVHVNRSPVSGVITEYVYQKGKFLVASQEAASSENEQTIITIRSQDGTLVVFKQIAGLIARRIVFSKKPGDIVQTGERIGLIKFGSRVDVILGPEWAIEVSAGARVSAGSSILARRGGEVEIPLAVQTGLKEPALCQT
ncbi:MAG TPA: phosphatidylserine decarboxylase [Bryobacteraceae bacterium]|jgi:phosphatidylserine decarboxylase|nr:phosphatidylserine decarboxylase [Bryobacteraceae bacterium]